MKKIALSIIALALLLAVSARPIAISCDEALRNKVDTHLSELDALGNVQLANQVFTKAGAMLKDIPERECLDYYGSFAKEACKGGNVLIAKLQASPFYCSWSGSGPATISFHYNKQRTAVQVFTDIPKSILRASDFSISFGNE